jgi:spermidine/putrescine-binding protein
VATSLLLFAAYRLEQGSSPLRAAVPATLGLGILAAPFLLGYGTTPPGAKTLNLYLWSNYIAPETLRKFEARHGVRANLDVYDTNEALLAKLQTASTDYDVVCPSNYAIEILMRQNLLRPLDHSALPHLTNIDPRFLDRPHDPGNRFSVPYFWGTSGIAYDTEKVGAVDSWEVLWDRRYAGRILMLDDARETLGAALKRLGASLNTTDGDLLRRAQRMLFEQKPLVRAYSASNFDEVLLSRDVWLAQGWSGQFAKVIDEDPRLAYVVPKEGSSLFVDPELAHAFIDFTLEADIAAEICRTMKYSTPNRAAMPLLPEPLRRNPAIFPPEDVLSRTELIVDIGEATVLYDRLWTEVKTGR